MLINFALSLSHTGIDLLQRADGGWRRVGSASILSANLAADLAELRAKGAALAPDGLKTKLVIPSEQIKYLQLPTMQTTRDDLHMVLTGATPYHPDELAIDFERGVGCTHIAAVARETLKEAEEFAFAHGFNPVCFVAVPDPDTFTQEIFFGPTSHTATILGPDQAVERDNLPVRLTGTRIKAQVLAADVAVAAAVPAMAAPYLDRVIGEYHPAPPVQAEVPLIAAAVAGSPHPVVFGGAVDPSITLAAPPRPGFVMPAAIAASIALLSVLLWAQYGPDTQTADLTPPVAETSEIAVEPPQVATIDTPLPGGVAPTAPLVSDMADTATDASAEVQIGTVLTPDQADAAYAATGVWQRAPRLAELPRIVPVDTVAAPASFTAPERIALPALPQASELSTDQSFVPLPDPPAADVTFDLDEDGFVRATPEGAITPDGAVVYAGLPDLPFRARPGSITDPAVQDDVVPDQATQPEDETAGNDSTAVTDPATSENDIAVIDGPPPVVPPLRPETLSADDGAAETTAGGVALTGLQDETDNTAADSDAVASLTPPAGAIRPQARPALPQTTTTPDEVEAVLGGIAFAEPEPLQDASALAVAASIRPAARPASIASQVAAARSTPPPAPEPEEPAVVAAAPVATPPPPPPAPAAPVAPQNYAPVPGGVARAATQENAIRLREMNLIGVYGQASARRALVRLGNGQYVRVQVGSELDGGQVTAIGENALNFVRRGTTYALQIPSG